MWFVWFVVPNPTTVLAIHPRSAYILCVRRRACAAIDAVDHLRRGALLSFPQMAFLFAASMACVILVLAAGPLTRVLVPALAKRP